MTGFWTIRRRVHGFADPQAGEGSRRPSNAAGTHFAGLQSPHDCYRERESKYLKIEGKNKNFSKTGRAANFGDLGNVTKKWLLN